MNKKYIEGLESKAGKVAGGNTAFSFHEYNWNRVIVDEGHEYLSAKTWSSPIPSESSSLVPRSSSVGVMMP